MRSFVSNFRLKSLLKIEGFSNSSTSEINHYLAHKFDLLGSGLLRRGLTEELILHPTHQFFSYKILKLISEDYQLIDWQKEIKSGFGFRTDRAFNNQSIDKTKPVDIKNCWELGRLQHLPQLAIASIHSENKAVLLKEFKDQTFDFIASNPVGMGVQWACSMDVGIRVANWLVAYDIFKQNDSADLLGDEFTLIFTDTIYQHGKFLWNNLEKKEGAAGNHYLFNLIGLLFVANYLTEDDEILSWRLFAEKEMVEECQKQFFSDGGNFEGSTTYHCLSAEAILYATALMLRHNKSLDKSYLQLVQKSFQFIKDVIKPNGELPQFGDNDSGRLFKFYSNQNLLDYQSLIKGFSSLFGINMNFSFEGFLIEQLTKGNVLIFEQDKIDKLKLKDNFLTLKNSTTTEIKFSSPIELSQIKHFRYEEFGIFIFKSSNFYLAISAISNKKMHHSWGHVHNDKLSFDLQVKGVDLVKDPGTYVYSSFPEKRNLFRSSIAHNGIVIDGVEQNKSIGLFYLDREVSCQLIALNDSSITLQAKYYGVKHCRKFSIYSDRLIIEDYCNKPFLVNINRFNAYSPIYGVIEKLNESI